MEKLFATKAPDGWGDTGKNPVFWLVLLFSVLLKYGYYGFNYFPAVDDHNMYGIFSLMSPFRVLEKYQMYTTRPVAVLLDTFVISRLIGQMWIVLLAITLLHFVTAWLLYKVFEKNNMKTGAVLAVIFCLMPLSNDATYWIPGSSRLVVGLFFAILSFYLFMLYLEKSSKKYRSTIGYLAGFALINLVSLGFYEQVAAFSFAGLLLLMLINFNKLEQKWLLAVPFVNLAILGAYYKAFSGVGNVAERGQLVQADFMQHSIDVWNRIKELMTIIPAGLMKNGILNGGKLLLSDKAVIFLLLAVAASVTLGVLYAREAVASSWKGSAFRFVLGLVLIILPYAPFFILQTIRIVNRNTFLSLIGVGLVVESLAGIFFIKWDLRVLRGIVAGLAVFAFLLANLAELNDYRSISVIDREIASNMAETLNEAKGSEWLDKEVVIFNSKPIYFTPTSRHFYNMTGSDWAFVGAMESILRTDKMAKFYPLEDYHTGLVKAEHLKQAILVGMDRDRRVYALTGEWKSDAHMELRLPDGKVFGNARITQAGLVYFEAAEAYRFAVRLE